MSIPSQTEMYKCVLESVRDLGEFSRKDAKNYIADRLNLTDAERTEETSSGALVYGSRIGWAISWLTRVGYIERTKKATYCITDLGKVILSQKLSFEDFIKKFRGDIKEKEGKESPEEIEELLELPEKNPLETLDDSEKTLNDQLAHELMERIMAIEGRDGDRFFEKIVTDLLEKMGYGQGKVTKFVNDGGIDGVIKTDPLGFDPILIQAKRYSKDHSIGRLDLQAFAGALGSVKRGVFITTSYFSKPAVEYASTYPHSDIVLIDGVKLTELMIKNNLGVSTKRIIEIKEIDSDYFEADDYS